MESAAIIAAIKQVIGDTPHPTPLHEPLFGGNEKKYVASCIDDGWVSSAGPFVERFEKELATYCNAPYALAMVNGTCALHAALAAAGVMPQDEVLIPSLTFVATANAVMHTGAVPHFVEVEETSLGICPEKLANYLSEIALQKNGALINKKTGRTIRALIPVHIFGHPCQIQALAELAESYGLICIADATEALGSIEHGQVIGARHTSVFSFNGNKIITSGGGGAVITHDEALYRKLKHLTTTARVAHAWEVTHDAVAWNYRMPNLNAALGYAQLEQLPGLLRAKRTLAMRYIEAFKHIPGVRVLTEPPDTQSNYWLVTLIANRPDKAALDKTLSDLHKAGLLCRPLWTPLHQLPMYRECPRDDVLLTESLATRIINLPSSPTLGMTYV